MSYSTVSKDSKSLTGLISPNANSAKESTLRRVTFADNAKTTMPFTRSKRWMTKVKKSKKLYNRKEYNGELRHPNGSESEEQRKG